MAPTLAPAPTDGECSDGSGSWQNVPAAVPGCLAGRILGWLQFLLGGSNRIRLRLRLQRKCALSGRVSGSPPQDLFLESKRLVRVREVLTQIFHHIKVNSHYLSYLWEDTYRYIQNWFKITYNNSVNAIRRFKRCFLGFG